MKIDNCSLPKSSFLAVEKDLSVIIDRIYKNERLKKLLYYTTSDCLDKPNLTQAQTQELFEKNIKLIPKISTTGEIRNFLVICFDDFMPNSNNPEFRDSIIHIDIFCHFDQWQLKGIQLRPLKIAAEVDSMLDDKYLTGIGKLHFSGSKNITLTSDYAGVCLIYDVVHGEEDKINPLDPTEEAAIKANFKKIFNE